MCPGSNLALDQGLKGLFVNITVAEWRHQGRNRPSKLFHWLSFLKFKLSIPLHAGFIKHPMF